MEPGHRSGVSDGMAPSTVATGSVADNRMNASRFMVQRLNSSDVGMPRRRASVTHAPANCTQPAQSVAVNMNRDFDKEQNFGVFAHPSPERAARASAPRQNSAGVLLGVNHLQDKTFGGSLRAHLRDSVRIPKTLQHHLSREALPKIDHYHPQVPTGSRPTLEELYLGEAPENKNDAEVEETAFEGPKFGWIQGVLIRCLLNIWGVMLFLRLSWVVAEAGLGQAILVILLATVVTSLTTLSMSAISTNGQIKGGGTYYMISRSLGPEFGAAIGIIFSVANAVGVSLHTVGFCESLNDLLQSFGLKIVDNYLNDTRIIGMITLIVLTSIVTIGMEWEAKAQLFLMGILAISLVNFVAGSIMGPTSDEEKGRGFIGFNGLVLDKNLYSDYQTDPSTNLQQTFFSVFAIFFPAATGILAGANISGDLRDPSSAIPKGTLLAIGVTSASYILFASLAAATVLRAATGNWSDYEHLDVSQYFSVCENRTCEFGLHFNQQVMELVSAFGPLNYAGCFAATLSSALACLVSAPKVFQALCKDRLFPYLHVFAKGYGRNQEPYRAYALTFVIALGCIMIASLDIIAPLISNFYLASYALVNFSTFHIDLIQPVSWRPTFKYYNKWLSLVGCILSVAAMFLCSWPTALMTLSIVFALYLIVKHRKPQVNWGSSTQAQTYKAALLTVHRLNASEDHVKTYTPQILVMTGTPNMRPSLVDFANSLCKNNSLMVCGHVMQERQSHQQRTLQLQKAKRWLRLYKTKAFYSLVDNMSFSAGVSSMLQTCGIGRLRPNILLLGYKNDWRTCDAEKTEDYFASIHTALEMHIAVVVLRVQDGLDYTGVIADFEWPELGKEGHVNKAFTSAADDVGGAHIPLGFSSSGSLHSNLTGTTLDNVEGGRVTATMSINSNDTALTYSKQKTNKVKPLFRDPQGGELSMEVKTSLLRFRLKQKRATIDVWWLYDDGGLSMLLPHILTTRANWSNSKLRVFCLIDEKKEHQSEIKNMKQLMRKFRIPVSDVVVIPDIVTPPSTATRAWFDNLTREFVRKDDAAVDNSSGFTIKESELMALKGKTFRHMRLRELLLQHSSEANLVVMNLPIPRKGKVSAPLYMAWLETLTANMPPFLLVRGNQKSVLTFYS